MNKQQHEPKKEDEFKIIDESLFDDNVSKDYVPEGFDTVEEYLSDLRETHKEDMEFDEENRQMAMDDKKFAAGEQWDKKVLEHREGLPCLTINTIPQFTAQLVGDWRESRKAIKVVPSENGDTDVASIRGDLIRSIEMKSRSNRIYDTAFESLVQCGDGAYRIAVEYSKNDVFDQEIYIRPIEDCLSIVWDRFSQDPTGRDARHCFVDDMLPKKEFMRKWPDTEASTLSDNLREDCAATGWVTEQGYRVTEHWRMIERTRILGMFEDGSTRFITDDNLEELIEQHGPPIRTRLAPVTYAQMHLVTGFSILSGPYEYQLNRLPVVRMTGRVVNVGGRRVRYGLVRFMKDAARLKNFWRSIAAEQLGYAPKAQWIAPESAVEGRENTFRRAHLERDPLLIYNDSAETPPQRIQPPAPEAALLNESNVNTQDMKDVTGIHDASLGIRSNETSGRAITARQREGDIAALTFYDNGNASILEGGDIINQLIGQIYDGTRIIRVVGEDQEAKFAKINDPNDPDSPDLSIGNYDVALSTGSSYTSRRAEAAQAMMEAIQVYPQLMEFASDIIVKAQDWPGAEELAERLAKTIPPELREQKEGEEPPSIPPQVLQQIQAEMQALQKEYESLKEDKSIEARKAAVDEFNAETQRLKVMAETELSKTELGVKTLTDALNSPDISTEQESETPATEPQGQEQGEFLI